MATLEEKRAKSKFHGRNLLDKTPSDGTFTGEASGKRKFKSKKAAAKKRSGMGKRKTMKKAKPADADADLIESIRAGIREGFGLYGPPKE